MTRDVILVITAITAAGLGARVRQLDAYLAATHQQVQELRERPAPVAIVEPDPRVEVCLQRIDYLRKIAQLVADRVEWGSRAALPRPLFDWTPIEIRTEASYRAALRSTR